MVSLVTGSMCHNSIGENVIEVIMVFVMLSETVGTSMGNVLKGKGLITEVAPDIILEEHESQKLYEPVFFILD
jgi:hypothetical protein